MRILLTIHHRLERDTGAPGVTLKLAEEFAKLGHETEIISFDDLPESLPQKTQPLLFPYFVASRVRKKTSRWDVIDASSGDAWLYSLLPRRRGRPLLVCRSHGLEHVSHERLLQEVQRGTERVSWKYPLYHGGARLWEVRMSMQRSDVLLLLNRQDLQYVVDKFGVQQDRVRLVQNGIPESFLGLPFRSADSNPSESLHIAQIGSYIRRKGVAYGARALNSILRRHHHVGVHFLGTLVDAGTVLRDFDPENHSRILVTPRFAHEELPALLANCQIKLFPTLSEGFSLALLEAMACGLAPVTTTAPGPSMVVANMENGLLVPPSDADALEKALESLILDRALLTRLRRRALTDAQGYSWRSIAERQIRLYEEFRERR